MSILCLFIFIFVLFDSTPNPTPAAREMPASVAQRARLTTEPLYFNRVDQKEYEANIFASELLLSN